MLVNTLTASAVVILGLSAGQAYAQAGSGASAPATITTPTPSGDAARTPALGDPSAKRRVRPRARPVPSTQNGTAPDRTGALSGAR